jgi:hypothetical protein
MLPNRVPRAVCVSICICEPANDDSLAYIESVKAVMDPNPMPPGLHQYSVIVTTANREMKFTAPTKERHDIWFNVSLRLKLLVIANDVM